MLNDERGKLVKIRGNYLPSSGDIAGCAACGALDGYTAAVMEAKHFGEDMAGHGRGCGTVNPAWSGD